MMMDARTALLIFVWATFQSPLIAIECTAAVDPVRTETWNLGPGRGNLKFDLAHDWYVVIKPQTRVTELRRRLGGLLRTCETAGIERLAQRDFVLRRQHPSISEALASLEVDSIHAFREAGSGFVYLTMTGLGGAVDPTGSAVPNWIDDFLRHPKNADVLLKLRRSRAKESHVFVGVSFGGVPWQVESYLGTQTDLVPVRAQIYLTRSWACGSCMEAAASTGTVLRGSSSTLLCPPFQTFKARPGTRSNAR
jgi:hypothetical protein